MVARAERQILIDCDRAAPARSAAVPSGSDDGCARSAGAGRWHPPRLRIGRRAREVVLAFIQMGALAGPLVAHEYSGSGEANALIDAGPSIIHAGTLLAVPGEAPEREKSLVVAAGRIVAIVDGFVSPAATDYPGATVIDLSERFVLPGLIDSHVHMTSTPGPSFQLDRVVQSDAHRAVWGAANARDTLLAGFTTVRDTAGFRGDSFDSVFALRDGIRAGKIPGPRMLVAGQGVGSLASQGDFLGYRSEIMDLFEGRAMCSGPYECRDAVRRQIKRGADFIKMVPTGWATGAAGGGDQQHMFADEMRAVVQTAHLFGRKVTAHATGLDGVKAALRAGADSIEHGRVLDEEAIGLFRETGAYLVPTLLVTTTFTDRESGRVPGSARNVSRDEAPSLDSIAATWFASVRTAHESGVKIAFGTDSAITPHGHNAREFALLVQRAAMSPMEAIVTATVNAADHLGLEREIGRLKPGMAADVIAVASSPLDDVTELERVVFVMRSGVVHSNRP